MQNKKRAVGRPRRHEEEALKPGTWRIGRKLRFALTLLSRQSGVEESVLLEHMIKARADADLVEKTLGAHWENLYARAMVTTRARCNVRVNEAHGWIEYDIICVWPSGEASKPELATM